MSSSRHLGPDDEWPPQRYGQQWQEPAPRGGYGRPTTDPQEWPHNARRYDDYRRDNSTRPLLDEDRESGAPTWVPLVVGLGVFVLLLGVAMLVAVVAGPH